MKRSLLLFSLSAMAWGQTPAQSPATGQQSPSLTQPPQTRGPVAVAQQDPNKVVATVNGQKVTAGQALKLLQAIPQTELQRFQQQGGLSAALQQIFLMEHLSDLAVQQHLDQQEPVKTQIEFTKQNMLAQAYINRISTQTNPSSQDIKNYYDQHPQEFQEAKLSAIIVNFAPTAGGTTSAAGRTEPQAKTKADDLVKKIRGGANFSELAKTDSDHKLSADKGGQLGSFSPEKLPKEISDPVFKLKAGEVTDPIREATAYYILKLDSLDKKTFEQAQNDIVAQLKNDEVRKVLSQQSQQYQVQVQDSDFFNLPGTVHSNTPSLARPTPGQPKTTTGK